MTYYDIKKDKLIYTTNPALMCNVEIGNEIVKNSKLRKRRRTRELVNDLLKRIDHLWGKS